MRILWLSGLPAQVQEEGLGGEDHGSQHELSWIVSHLPPPTGVDLHVACLWPGGSARRDVSYKGAIFHLLPCPRRGRAALFFLRDKIYYEALYHELRPDIVHGWGTEDSAGLVAAALSPRQHVLSTQGVVNAILPHIDMTIRYVICALMERVILARVKNVFAENAFSAKQVARLGFKGSTYMVDHPLKAEYLQATPSAGTGRRVIFIGRISRAKGYADCVHAFADAAPSDWSLHMIGSGNNRDETKLRGLVANRALQGRFYHERHARLSDLIALMQQSSILLLPTYIDCGPTALKEALCMGLWPICYDCSGPGVYIPQAGFGSLASYGDRRRLAQLLGECIANQPWMNVVRRKRCGEFVRAAFTPDMIWPQLLRNYRHIMGKE